jgi:hypothetical protein
MEIKWCTGVADQVQVPSNRVRYRSSEQVVLVLAFAVAVAIAGAATAHQARSTAGAILQAIGTVAIAAAMVVLVARAGLWATTDGIEIRNPLSRRVLIPWSEIRGFRIGRYRLLGAVCIVDLKGGTARHAFAIQVPNRALNRPDAKARLIIEELNSQLHQRL